MDAERRHRVASAKCCLRAATCQQCPMVDTARPRAGATGDRARSARCLPCFSAPRRHQLRRPDRASRLFPRRIRGAAAAGSTRRPMRIWWRCASSCPGRPAARSASPSACRAPAIRARSRPGPALPCRRRWRWSLFAFGVGALGDALRSGWLHGLMVAAVAVVAQAVLAYDALARAGSRARHACGRGRRRWCRRCRHRWGQITAIVARRRRRFAVAVAERGAGTIRSSCRIR